MSKDTNNQFLLEKDTRADTALNYAFLRKKAIELLQGYSGSTWSDFNLHDPGVTVLEYLCFGLTDLAYRTNFPFEDILTGKDGKINNRKNLFFNAEQVLTTNPVTVSDFRRLVIDQVPELYNVWLEPVLSASRMQYIKGLYKVIVQLSNETIENSIAEADKRKVQRLEDAVIEKVKTIVHSNRNVGEDFEEFILLDRCNVEIEADVSISKNKFAEDVLADIYEAVSKALNPELRFYSEKELKQKGYSHEKIHEGPRLVHGFIIEEELRPRTRFIDPSDLLRAITEVEGVKLVQHLVVKVNNVEYDNSIYNLDENEFPYFVFNKDKPSIRLFNENYEVPVKPNLFFNLLTKKADSGKRHYIKKPVIADDHFPIDGKYRNLQDYYSIQHLFPVIYKLGSPGLDKTYMPGNTSNVSASETAKAKQLKAYLMLFEQLMANYLAQLTNIDTLFSSSVNEATAQTYFFQPLYAVPGAENILSAFFNEKESPTEAGWDKFMADQHNGYVNTLKLSIETDDTFIKRKTRAIDHMLARFNCSPQKYPVETFVQTYKWKSNHSRINAELLWKSGLLENIVALTRDRNLAHNYYRHDPENSKKGFEARMSRLLFIQDIRSRPLADMPGNSDAAIAIHPVASEDKPREATANKNISIVYENEHYDIFLDEEQRKFLEVQPDGAVNPGLKNITERFLKEALDEMNYRIIPMDIISGQQLLIFRMPSEKHWQLVGKFPNRIAAGAALNTFIDQLAKISIQSEGFHLVEHVLLKPPLQSRFFGFDFYDEKGHLLCRHHDWMTFEEREKVLKVLVNATNLPDPDDYAAVAKYLEGICRINTEHEERKDDGEENHKLDTGYDHQKENMERPSVFYYSAKHNKESVRKVFRRIIRNLQSFGRKNGAAFPRIESRVRIAEGYIVSDDFFNFRLTVVFPSWPARFQDPVFRLFAERLFVKNSPAYMRLNFRWLDMPSIRNFEAKYFQWQETISNLKFSTQYIDDAAELVSFLQEDPEK